MLQVNRVTSDRAVLPREVSLTLARSGVKTVETGCAEANVAGASGAEAVATWLRCIRPTSVHICRLGGRMEQVRNMLSLRIGINEHRGKL